MLALPDERIRRGFSRRGRRVQPVDSNACEHEGAGQRAQPHMLSGPVAAWLVGVWGGSMEAGARPDDRGGSGGDTDGAVRREDRMRSIDAVPRCGGGRVSSAEHVGKERALAPERMPVFGRSSKRDSAVTSEALASHCCRCAVQRQMAGAACQHVQQLSRWAIHGASPRFLPVF